MAELEAEKARLAKLIVHGGGQGGVTARRYRDVVRHLANIAEMELIEKRLRQDKTVGGYWRTRLEWLQQRYGESTTT